MLNMGADKDMARLLVILNLSLKFFNLIFDNVTKCIERKSKCQISS